jgi:AraC family transcriptional regulator
MPPVWDRSFLQRFLVRWGQESAVISAAVRRVEYPDCTQLLSLKAVSGGHEDYFVDGRRIRVDDDTFLILNAGRTYGSLINAISPVHSFSIFFGPGLAQGVQDALSRSTEALLGDPSVDRHPPPEFDERLREHECTVTPVLRDIQQVVDAGGGEDAWLEERLHLLMARMLRLQGQEWRTCEVISAAKRATRRELHRRVGLGMTFIHTHFHRPIGLEDIARAAHLSPFHFLRTFKQVYGITPSGYLNRKRTLAALRLLQESEWTLTQIAELVGFGSRSTLYRHLRAVRDPQLQRRLAESRAELPHTASRASCTQPT